jgi:serine/threonine protein kinase/tetratricopeptide (TPR) repeat protein
MFAVVDVTFGIRCEFLIMLFAHDHSHGDALTNASGSGLLLRPGGPARRMGRYHVLKLLGAGGMGAVYEAFDPELGRKVAIKVLHACEASSGLWSRQDATQDGLNRARLLREAKNLARLAHPNVVPIFDVGTLDDGSVFVAMEFIAGRTLREIFENHQVGWRQKLDYALAAGAGLAAAHAAGLLHRDFKPENVMVGDDGVVRVLDFGLSKDDSNSLPIPEDTEPGIDLSLQTSRTASDRVSAVSLGDDEITHPGGLLGTPAYMPPEQVHGRKAQAAGDLFSFACVVFEAVCGSRPFPNGVHAASERVQAIACGSIDWPAHLHFTMGAWFRRLVAQSLAYAPEERGQGVGELVEAIREGLRRDRLQRGLLRTLALIMLPVAGLVALASAPERPAAMECREVSAAVDEIWHEGAATRMQQRFAASGLHNAGTLALESARALDQWKESWLRYNRELCPETREARNLAQLDVHLREESRACFAENLAQVSALLEVWREPTFVQMMGAPEAVASLSSPGECVDPEILRHRTPLPIEPQRRKRAREQLAAVKASLVQIAQADYSGARKALQEVANQGADLDLQVQAAWAGAMGDLLYRETGKNLGSTIALQQSVLWTIAADQPARSLGAALDLWFVRVYRGNMREEDAERVAEQAALLKRTHAPREHLALFARNRGIWASMHNDFAATLAHLQESLVHVSEVFGTRSVRVASALDDLGYTAYLVGDLELAESYDRQMLEMRKELLPPGHPDRSRAHIQLADVLSVSGRLIDAKATLANAWRECTEAGVPHAMCAESWAAYVQAAHVTGDYESASAGALALAELESEMGRRQDPTSPWTLHFLSLMLARRGELEAAASAADLALAKVRGEGHIHPRALALGLLISAEVALERREPDDAQRLLGEAKEVLATPTEESRFLWVKYGYLRGRLALEVGAYDQALAWSEEALAGAQQVSVPADLPSQIALSMAQIHFAREEYDEARAQVLAAIAAQRRVDGMMPHLLMPCYQLLARIDAVQCRYDDARANLSLASSIFDPRQVTQDDPQDFEAQMSQMRRGIGQSPRKSMSACQSAEFSRG